MVQGHLAPFSLGLVRPGQIGHVHRPANAGRTRLGGAGYPMPQTPVVHREVTRFGLHADLVPAFAMPDKVRKTKAHGEEALLVCPWNQPQTTVFARDVVKMQTNIEHLLGHA